MQLLSEADFKTHPCSEESLLREALPCPGLIAEVQQADGISEDCGAFKALIWWCWARRRDVVNNAIATCRTGRSKRFWDIRGRGSFANCSWGEDENCQATGRCKSERTGPGAGRSTASAVERGRLREAQGGVRFQRVTCAVSVKVKSASPSASGVGVTRHHEWVLRAKLRLNRREPVKTRGAKRRIPFVQRQTRWCPSFTSLVEGAFLGPSRWVLFVIP
jgi:hypothetical protein